MMTDVSYNIFMYFGYVAMLTMSNFGAHSRVIVVDKNHKITHLTSLGYFFEGEKIKEIVLVHSLPGH